MTTPRQSTPHRARFSRNTAEAHIRERILYWEAMFDQADMVDANCPPEQGDLLNAVIDERRTLTAILGGGSSRRCYPRHQKAILPNRGAAARKLKRDRRQPKPNSTAITTTLVTRQELDLTTPHQPTTSNKRHGGRVNLLPAPCRPHSAEPSAKVLPQTRSSTACTSGGRRLAAAARIYALRTRHSCRCSRH